MTYTTVLHRSKRRAATKDRGSILIFVVGVLVLLALSATAFLASARGDRTTTKQNEFNTQVDLLLDGCRQAALAKILGDESIPKDTLRTTLTIKMSDGFVDDTWLASRLPIWSSGISPGTLTMAVNNTDVRWRHLSRGIFSNSSTFETPFGQTYTPANGALPASIGTLPALNMGGGNYVASDTDGDGIADAGLVRLPISKINGITYYAAFRIIDHSSAVNLSTAMSRDDDFDATGASLSTTGVNHVPVGYFATGIGLKELLYGGTTEWNKLANYRFPTAPTDVWTLNSGTLQKYRSLGDKFHHDMVRRRDNPSAGVATFGAGDQAALAKGFTLRDSSYRSVVEQTLDQSLYGTNVPWVAYQANQVPTWFNNFFNFTRETYGTTNTYRPIRAFSTTTNRQSTYVRGADMNAFATLPGSTSPQSIYNWIVAEQGGSYSGMGERMRYYHPTVRTDDAFSPLPEQCSVNTGDFGDLFRAFWNVMCDPANPYLPEGTEWIPADPADTAGAGLPARVRGDTTDRCWIQNATLRPDWTVTNQMLVRAAQAAVNLIDLRDTDDDITVKTLYLPARNGKTYRVDVFGTERQPYMTRLLYEASGNTGATFAALELYNPYDTPIVMRDNWTIGTLDRNATGYNVTPIATLPANTTIAAKGFLILHQGPKPAGVTFDPSATALPIAGLTSSKRDNTLYTFERDVVLLRPRLASGVLTTADDPDTEMTPEPIETASMVEVQGFVPLDQIPTNVDYGGIGDPVGTLNITERSNSATDPWRFVYQPAHATWQAATAVTLGAYNTVAGTNVPAIQIQNRNWPMGAGASPFQNAIPYNYPFGGLARLGDLMQVPYIGGVTITDVTGAATLVDMVSISVDAYFSRDTNDGNEATEPIGRFDPTFANYAWSNDLLTYFTVNQHPTDEYEWPLVRNHTDRDITAYTPTRPLNRFDWWSAARNGSFNSPDPEPTRLYDPSVPNTQPLGAVEGLININTASVKVLSMLPWVPGGTNGLKWDVGTNPPTLIAGPDSNNRDDNEDIANAIVYYRDVNPGNVQFQHVADLLNVPGFKNATAVVLAIGDPDDAFGEDTPINTALNPNAADQVDKVRNDVEENTLILNRVSNLITTRSDVFTVYIDLQGWRNAGTSNAELVVQRRAAMMVDRSKYVGDAPTAETTRVPTE